jgi:hypothetical protein
LDRLVEPDTRDDPDSPLRWTCKSTRELAETLTAQGHPVSDDTVGRLPKQQGYRVRAWKTELARLADETGLQVTVCHLPPGTSEWNRIEHRLFSAISMNWRGRPLDSRYRLGTKVGDEELAAVPLVRHGFHGEWNYTIRPAAEQTSPAR